MHRWENKNRQLEEQLSNIYKIEKCMTKMLAISLLGPGTLLYMNKRRHEQGFLWQYCPSKKQIDGNSQMIINLKINKMWRTYKMECFTVVHTNEPASYILTNKSYEHFHLVQ